ncbi:hypothetical protein GCM10008927_08630 [Amylibacter ulvae]|uniref:Uncharacterized protein n=1 Tax=Paramylibacter ulvae TaxID=1651968 RepID=A0ABQ3CXE7_9RHOB|nr:hypothetical protein [Amylibacter ulvae]GHA45845.1 hypothetical protein GCM10008927_08630 [Amylibacter ulvae]
MDKRNIILGLMAIVILFGLMPTHSQFVTSISGERISVIQSVIGFGADLSVVAPLISILLLQLTRFRLPDLMFQTLAVMIVIFGGLAVAINLILGGGDMFGILRIAAHICALLGAVFLLGREASTLKTATSFGAIIFAFVIAAWSLIAPPLGGTDGMASGHGQTEIAKTIG